MEHLKKKNEKEIKDNTENNEAKMVEIIKEKDEYKLDLENFKNEFNLKMTQIKIMEMELEEKLGE